MTSQLLMMMDGVAALSAENIVTDTSFVESHTSTSASKINLDNTKDACEENSVECNLLINPDLFMSLLFMIAICPQCFQSLDIEHKLLQKKGLAHFFTINCTECDWNLNFRTSKESIVNRDQQKPVRKTFEVNARAIIAFREYGHGYSAIKSFCRIMNMPPPMSCLSFQNTKSDLHDAYVPTKKS